MYIHLHRVGLGTTVQCCIRAKLYIWVECSAILSGPQWSRHACSLSISRPRVLHPVYMCIGGCHGLGGCSFFVTRSPYHKMAFPFDHTTSVCIYG